MGFSSSDTSPDAAAFLVSRLARMTPEEKLQRVRDLTLTAARLALAGLRARHPGETESKLLLRLARLRLGDALVNAAYPADDRGGA
jgi:hypothetical protein